MNGTWGSKEKSVSLQIQTSKLRKQKYVVSLRLKCCKFYLWGEVEKRERGKRECGKKERRNGVDLMY